jgi:hypothetical protein
VVFMKQTRFGGVGVTEGLDVRGGRGVIVIQSPTLAMKTDLRKFQPTGRRERNH